MIKADTVTNAAIVAVIGSESGHLTQQRAHCLGPFINERSAREDRWRPY